MTAFTTAARQARAQAAANKLEEERQETERGSHVTPHKAQPLANGSVHTTHVEVHTHSENTMTSSKILHVAAVSAIGGEKKKGDKEMAFSKNPGITKLKVFTACKGQGINRAEPDRQERRTSQTASKTTSGPDYISLWPSAKDVMIANPDAMQD